MSERSKYSGCLVECKEIIKELEATIRQAESILDELESDYTYASQTRLCKKLRKALAGGK